MVLEDAFSDEPPTNDNDTYGDSDRSNYQNHAIQIDLSQAYRPFPILGPLFGFNQKNLVAMTANIAREAPRILDRSLAQEEVDAVVSSVSQYQRVHSWIYCTGMLLGWYRSYQTRKEMVFPAARAFKNVSLNLDRFGPFRGPAARGVWNVIRTTLWVAWWGMPAYIIGGFSGQAAMAQTQLSDKRLQRFHHDMKSEGASKRLKEAVHNRQQRLPQRAVQAPMKGTQTGDDMSPQTVADMGRDGYSETSSRIREFEQQATFDTSSMDDGAATDKSPPSSRGFGSNRGQSATRSPTPQPGSIGGSAWDRIRKQASSGESSSSPTRWQPGSTTGGNEYTFDEQEEEKQLAQAEAQREFDARIERERQGKDFDASSGARRSW